MNNDNTELPQNEEIKTPETETPENNPAVTPETETPESPATIETPSSPDTQEPIVTSFEFVQVVPEQYETLVGISQRTDLLTNRIEVMLILNIILVALFIFQLMRSSK